MQKFDLKEKLKYVATSKLLNPSGGAVYLPFTLPYYAAIAGNESDLEKHFKIDFITEEIAVAENHLYHGTAALKAKFPVQMQGIKVIPDNSITESSFTGNGNEAGILMTEVRKHYEKLCKVMGEEYVKSICTIRLQIRPPASLPE